MTDYVILRTQLFDLSSTGDVIRGRLSVNFILSCLYIAVLNPSGTYIIFSYKSFSCCQLIYILVVNLYSNVPMAGVS
jgi:hypothetical protein